LSTEPPPRIRKTLSLFARLGVKRFQFALAHHAGRMPVVTYATWRTASTSVHHAIRASGTWPAIKVHSLNPSYQLRSADGSRILAAAGEHVGDRVVRRHALLRGRAARWVLLLRDPMSVALSMAAGGLDVDVAGIASPEELRSRVRSAPTWAIDSWLEHDVLASLGWSPFTMAFDADRGWAEATFRHGHVLVMRTDIPDSAKSEALSRFLARPVRVGRGNGSAEHGKASGHRDLRHALASEPGVVEAALSTAAAKHFWSDAQRTAMRDRWLPGRNAA
jgi:hypothetical protein